jgi:hypothetical protein
VTNLRQHEPRTPNVQVRLPACDTPPLCPQAPRVVHLTRHGRLRRFLFASRARYIVQNPYSSRVCILSRMRISESHRVSLFGQLGCSDDAFQHEAGNGRRECPPGYSLGGKEKEISASLALLVLIRNTKPSPSKYLCHQHQPLHDLYSLFVRSTSALPS